MFNAKKRLESLEAKMNTGKQKIFTVKINDGKESDFTEYSEKGAVKLDKPPKVKQNDVCFIYQIPKNPQKILG